MRIISSFALFVGYIGYAYLMVDNYPKYVEAGAYYGFMYPLVMWWLNAIAVTGATLSILLHLLKRKRA